MIVVSGAEPLIFRVLYLPGSILFAPSCRAVQQELAVSLIVSRTHGGCRCVPSVWVNVSLVRVVVAGCVSAVRAKRELVWRMSHAGLSCPGCGSSNIVDDDLYCQAQLVCVDCGSVVSEGTLAKDPVGGSGTNRSRKIV